MQTPPDSDFRFPLIRPRRNRKSPGIRQLIRETRLDPGNLVLPVFVCEGEGQRQPISSMPGVFRHSPDQLIRHCHEAASAGIPAIALFPAIDDQLKNPQASEALNENGLLQNTVKRLRDALPDLVIITDVALDPYSSDGHDGLVKDGQILNDETLEVLAQMAISHAKAGADIVAPSDMMDGRVSCIRQSLDQAGFQQTSILSYTAKYASSFYGPFREALGSAPKKGDKKTYQMDPSNSREALREAYLDQSEAADMLMVKPALPYLDVIALLRQNTHLPIAAYQVSGEYAMIHAAAEKGWLNKDEALLESLTAIRRAGADFILTYWALDLAKSF